jgi:hypothetical protein
MIRRFQPGFLAGFSLFRLSAIEVPRDRWELSITNYAGMWRLGHTFSTPPMQFCMHAIGFLP